MSIGVAWWAWPTARRESAGKSEREAAIDLLIELSEYFRVRANSTQLTQSTVAGGGSPVSKLPDPQPVARIPSSQFSVLHSQFSGSPFSGLLVSPPANELSRSRLNCATKENAY